MVEKSYEVYDLIAYIRKLERRVKILETIGSGHAITGVIHIGESIDTPIVSPPSGGFLYVEDGKLKYRGNAGTITTVGLS